MPAYTRGRLREVITFVALNEFLFYGWKAPDLASNLGVTSGDLVGALGHVDSVMALNTPSAILITGANSPKPARVVKRNPTAPITQSGSTSTFVAYDKMADANVAGWSLAKAARGVKLTSSTANTRACTAVATLSNGLNYCFPMNKADFTTYGAELGLQSGEQMNTAGELKRVATGTRQKPGVAAKEVGTGTFSSFFSTNKLDDITAAGYSLVRPERNEYA